MNAPAADNLVVTYHYVRPANSDGVAGLSPQAFDEQLAMIGRAYRFVTIEEFVERRRACAGLALITFDDALRDQHGYAFDVLERHRSPAVFFAPMRPYSDEPDRWCTQHLLHALAQELGWCELERRVDAIVGEAPINAAEMNRLYHYESPHKRRLKYLLAFALSAHEAMETLRTINATVGLDAADWYMTCAQLIDLQKRGHAIGGHGFDHVPYTTLSPEGQASDMRRACELMNALLGEQPRALAYPFGRFDETTVKLAHECGYIHAFSTDDRVDAMNVLTHLEVAA